MTLLHYYVEEKEMEEYLLHRDADPNPGRAIRTMIDGAQVQC
jgi:hypothetical protein